MRKGFTLMELIIVFGIIVAVSAWLFADLGGARNNADLTSTTQEVVTILRRAQSDAMAQASDAAWGVHFENATATAPFYALFTGTYAASTTVDRYMLPPTVAYETSTLASGASLDVIFSPLTGAASVSTTIGLFMPRESAAFSSTVSVASSGVVSD